MSRYIENIRRRNARAIKYVTSSKMYVPEGDYEKLARATYTIVMHDVPEMLQQLEQASKWIENLKQGLRDVYNDEAPTMHPRQLEQIIQGIMENGRSSGH